jgi:hypothetical protein
LGRLLLVAVALVASALAAAASVWASAQPLSGFRSPSGNIVCLFVPAARDDAGRLLDSQLLCSIRRASYSATLQDRCRNPRGRRGAGVDWHGWRLGVTGPATVLCSGGVLYAGAPRVSYVTLAYGRSWRRGVFTCRSRVSGVTCRSAGGHGVFVSRESWRAW